MCDHGHFFSYEGHKERRTGKIRGAFSRMYRALDGRMLACAPASPAQGLHHHVFVCFLPIHSGHQVRWTYQPGWTSVFRFSLFQMCGLEKLGLLIKAG